MADRSSAGTRSGKWLEVESEDIRQGEGTYIDLVFGRNGDPIVAGRSAQFGGEGTA